MEKEYGHFGERKMLLSINFYFPFSLLFIIIPLIVSLITLAFKFVYVLLLFSVRIFVLSFISWDNIILLPMKTFHPVCTYALGSEG